jgi:hypothetical protein
VICREVTEWLKKNGKAEDISDATILRDVGRKGYQQSEIDRLRAQLERQDEELKQLLAWVNGDSDALTTLQRTYMDPRTSTSDRIKACAAAVAYERHKLTVQLRVGPSVLSERLARARAIKAAEPKVIEHSPSDAA